MQLAAGNGDRGAVAAAGRRGHALPCRCREQTLRRPAARVHRRRPCAIALRTVCCLESHMSPAAGLATARMGPARMKQAMSDSCMA